MNVYYICASIKELYFFHVIYLRNAEFYNETYDTKIAEISLKIRDEIII
jgi:hypothetical protein